MKDIIKELENKTGIKWEIIEKRIKENKCTNCGKKLGKFKHKGKKWDGHSYWHKCGCISANIITCIG